MTHRTSSRFWRCYEKLPKSVQQRADDSFELLKNDPNHNSLNLRKVGRVWTARVTDHYRVLGTSIPGGILWFWIGDHDEYERLLKSAY